MKYLSDLKKFIRNEELTTRRLIVKNSRKNDYNDIKRQLHDMKQKEKRERYLRNNYPSVKLAYDKYRLTMDLVEKK